MSVDYNSVAGYGIKVTGNLSEKGVEVLEEQCEDEIEEFIFNLQGELNYASTGNHFSGDIEYVIYVEDPLNEDQRLEKLKAVLELNKDMFNDITLKWINEICVW